MKFECEWGAGRPCWVVSFSFDLLEGVRWCPVLQIHNIDERGAIVIAVATAERLLKRTLLLQRHTGCVHVPGTAAFPELDGSGVMLEALNTPEAT